MAFRPPRVIFQRVHVSPEEFGRIMSSEQAHRRRIAEKATALWIAAKRFPPPRNRV